MIAVSAGSHMFFFWDIIQRRQAYTPCTMNTVVELKKQSGGSSSSIERRLTYTKKRLRGIPLKRSEQLNTEYFEDVDNVHWYIIRDSIVYNNN